MSLHLSQLQMLENQRLPADVGAGLVFWDSELERLAVRIDELYAETTQEKANRRCATAGRPAPPSPVRLCGVVSQACANDSLSC